MDELLTVKEFSGKAGITPQAVYKELNKADNRLKEYVVLVDNRKMLKASALTEVYGKEVEQPDNPASQPVEQPVEQPDNPASQPVEQPDNQKQSETESITKEIIDLLRQELEVKNQQIAELEKLLDQEQKITAMSHQRILELEAKAEQPTQDEQPNEQPQANPKRGLLWKLFHIQKWMNKAICHPSDPSREPPDDR